ncbi:D-3-phosphoglycerate dehydrogenase [Myxococcus stipitatus DSM 14675]|uniref:D-3-phosphoglycerate dehydrogenase n=1 Tax=Myxococcus stipitatus (strain DSM 14675 / JCM 12634 / Mx s8) TaxID=1278073 RepID=L7UE45_MYXSD|nr:D-glycerate dehydrogenase [Myxococcus stipitatus]AGC47191.1 D-3-phosphoglycerate dehydrogenase [Myxococcus stipitatus DSM 14675]
MPRTLRPRVFVTRQLPGEALGRLSKQVDLSVWEAELPPPPETLLAEAARSDGLVTLLTDRVDARLLASAPGLRAVSNVAVGYDNIDVRACTERRVAVGNTPGALTETSADFAFALILGLARRVAEADAYIRAGHWRTWSPTLLLGTDVYGATLGIVGPGAIGSAVARRARGFGMRILYVGREARPALEVETGAVRVDKATLLAEADIISLHVPLTPATRHWVGRGELAAMKPGALLVNTARGGVVDPVALVEALRDGRLGGAALDVTDPEPLPPDSPLMTLPNVLLAPHIASASHATRGRMASMAVDNLLAALEGRRPPHCVNPEVFP